MKQLTVKDIYVLSEVDEEKRSWVSLEMEGIFGCPHVCGHKADEKKRSMAHCYKSTLFHARSPPDSIQPPLPPLKGTLGHFDWSIVYRIRKEDLGSLHQGFLTVCFKTSPHTYSTVPGTPYCT